MGKSVSGLVHRCDLRLRFQKVDCIFGRAFRIWLIAATCARGSRESVAFRELIAFIAHHDSLLRTIRLSV
jgi:hypothetical protein